MIILGIDPGYGRLGYAVLQKEKSSEKLLDYACLETSPKSKHGHRILKIAQRIEDLIKNFKPDVLATEKVYFTKNQKTAMEVSEIRGIIIYIALKNRVEVAEFTPLEVKSAVCGYGKAGKEQVQKMVKMILKLEKDIKQDDAADAIALCLTYSGRFVKHY